GTRDSLAKVAVAVTDLVGNIATKFLRYLPDDLFLETTDPSYAEVSGAWTSTTNAAWGTNARIAEVSELQDAEAQWVLPLFWSGRYEVYTQVPAVSNAASTVVIQVLSGEAIVLSVTTSNQLPGRQWVYLGSAFLDAALTNLV